MIESSQSQTTELIESDLSFHRFDLVENNRGSVLFECLTLVQTIIVGCIVGFVGCIIIVFILTLVAYSYEKRNKIDVNFDNSNTNLTSSFVGYSVENDVMTVFLSSGEFITV